MNRFIIFISIVLLTTLSCKKENPDDSNPLPYFYPGIPELLIPAAGFEYIDTLDEITTATITFTWSIASNAVEYQFLFDTISDFSNPIVNVTSSNTYNLVDFAACLANTYYWKVRSVDANDSVGGWSVTRNLIFTVYDEEDPIEPLPIIPPGSQPIKLSTGFTFTYAEGPAWDGDATLYFSDFNANTIYKLYNGTITSINTTSDGANGLFYDKSSSQLVVCIGGSAGTGGYLTYVQEDGDFGDVIVSQYNGNPFNRPNDVTMDASGGIYFTDPTWGTIYTGGVKGVYYYSSVGVLTQIISDLNKPNGIILSPDESVLYIDDSDKLEVFAYDVISPGVLSNKRTFATLDIPGPGTTSGADGVAIDTAGNLYVAYSEGVQIFNDEGVEIDIITLPEGPSNCAFGGVDMKTLFITTQHGLYSIMLNTEGI